MAASIARWTPEGDGETLVHLASSERRAEEIGRALHVLAPDIDTMVLPAWDCLPYDRASPSREIMGRRMRALRWLGEKPARARVLVTSPEALVQRTPPRTLLEGAFFEIAVGDLLDRDVLADFAARTGYVTDDRIDEAGEIAFLGEVIDIFPADAAQPVRIVLAQDGRIAEIRAYDPLSQRSDGELDRLSIGPASELVVMSDRDGPDAEGAPTRSPGCEHEMSTNYGALQTLVDFLPAGLLSQDVKVAQRRARVEAQIAEAYEARVSLRGVDGTAPQPVRSVYQVGRGLSTALKRWTALQLDLVGIGPIDNLAIARNPGRAFCDVVEEHLSAGRKVVLTGTKAEQRALAKALRRGLDIAPTPIDTWEAVQSAESATLYALDADLDSGFTDLRRGLIVIAASDVLGGRLAAKLSRSAEALLADPDLRIGDVVLHEDHGVGVLQDLKQVEVDGVVRDALELGYHGGASLLAPVEEIGRIWRYGAEESAVTLDRLKGEAWRKRRAEVSREIDDTARELVALATARSKARCSPLVAPKSAYAKFAARFSYPETPDQAHAIEAMLGDMASGRPMDRLICGDVGFGKTEVALRAAAVAALNGRQVALAAPTTVLARQHFETFTRRFAGLGVKVAQLSRLVSQAQAEAVRASIASGEVGVVIGTHAIASEKVAFADLGLMIIDEEQKFGSELKAQLRDMVVDGHLLTLTATPIPRTLQGAMVGVQDVSVIASPPARRRPIRTFLAPFDAATLRTALLREQRRGGQSFFVVPRIEDISPLAVQLADIVPELSVKVAHGGLSAEAVDTVMVEFADGQGDVLLATNIIESGLDVPRANTMFIWRPDRFGLSQLHQLRGRVGRGRVQGIAYLLTDAAQELSEATRSRLSTLEAFDRLGSGLAISARDLDLRGGGDLVGDAQAGHMKMIGASLYQRLLQQAVIAARGEGPAADWTPAVNIGEAGLIPAEYVPDAVTRINLYARLARMQSADELDDFEEELEDRFGVMPQELLRLLKVSRLQALARISEVRQVIAGPKGIALTVGADAASRALQRCEKLAPEAYVSGDRLILPLSREGAHDQFGLTERVLARLAA